MRTRTFLALAVPATLLSLSVCGVANAQGGGNIGRQIERGIRSSVGNMIAGPQSNYYQNPYYGYGPNQPFYGPYQGQRGLYSSPGSPYWGTRSGYYQGPMTNVYQPGRYVRTQPTYDQQLQETTYVAPVVQRYQVPTQYAGTPAGYVITYGGRNYLTGSDGTMTPYNGPVAR